MSPASTRSSSVVPPTWGAGWRTRHRSSSSTARLLAERPVWLFSSGPVGTDRVDAKGRDVRTSAVPKEFAEFRDMLQPMEERVFFGAYDPSAPPVGMAERLGMQVMRAMPAARDALPAGDFRDWPEIEAWAASIGDALTVAAATA